jgi:hypothetical protein
MLIIPHLCLFLFFENWNFWFFLSLKFSYFKFLIFFCVANKLLSSNSFHQNCFIMWVNLIFFAFFSHFDIIGLHYQIFKLKLKVKIRSNGFYFEFLYIHMSEKGTTYHGCHGFKWKNTNTYMISNAPLNVFWLNNKLGHSIKANEDYQFSLKCFFLE